MAESPTHLASSNLTELITEQELAHRWRKSPRTLQRWRHDRSGPVWLRLGGSVAYRLEDILAFEEASRMSGADR